MDIKNIHNINRCTVTPLANGTAYKIEAADDLYIHLYDGDEDTAHLWGKSVILPASYDFTQVAIRTAGNLPSDAEIAGDENEMA